MATRKNNPASIENSISNSSENKAELASKTMKNCMIFYEKGRERVKSTSELQERIIWFFQKCAESGQFPTVEKMCTAIGIPRKTVWEWTSGRNGSSLVQDTDLSAGEIVQLAKDVLASCDSELVMQNQIYPATWIFRAKNFYGMSDKQEITIEPQKPLGRTMSMEELRASVPELLESDLADECLEFS
ncbi:MAG: hypothetical protein SOW08_01670 [Lachnospiraceae bacterium]|nr:hypothetical protein [Lachnospiraceae bacterium]